MHFLADLVALLHALIVVYIGGGVVAILLGWWRNWAWTRAFWFRFTHLLICLIVFLFEVANQPCPLTVFEQQLREQAGTTVYHGGFIAHYVSQTIHLEVQPWVLSGPTLVLALLVFVLYWKADPGRLRDEESVEAKKTANEPAKAAPLGVKLVEYVGLVALTSFGLPLANYWVARAWPWWRSSSLPMAVAFVGIGLLLCLLDRRAAGLQVETSRWRRRDLRTLGFWVVPPLLTICVYGPFTDHPFRGISWPQWLLSAVAQELVFFGFLYAKLVKRWGEGPVGWRGALSWPVLLSALAFCLWHWPNLLVLDGRYMVFQAAYTVLGAVWCLQMRRWTGSLVPGITNHIVVNYLASVL